MKVLIVDVDVEVVGACDRGDEAAARIRELLPELVILDIQMRQTSGIEVARQVGPAAMPMTVFVTAYDRYAVEAFELNAVDFLLKPFSRERFGATVEQNGRHRMLHVGEIELVEAAGNYIVVQTRASEQFILRRILDTEEWLDP